jgi:hypothetical protein
MACNVRARVSACLLLSVAALAGCLGIASAQGDGASPCGAVVRGLCEALFGSSGTALSGQAGGPARLYTVRDGSPVTGQPVQGAIVFLPRPVPGDLGSGRGLPPARAAGAPF